MGGWGGFGSGTGLGSCSHEGGAMPNMRQSERNVGADFGVWAMRSAVASAARRAVSAAVAAAMSSAASGR